MMPAIYFGAGTDIRPIKFCQVDTYYYVDSQPYSEFGLKRSKEWKNGTWTGKYTNGFSRPLFIPKLDQQMESIDMELLQVENNIRTYTDGVKKVIYYTNTSIPEHCDKLRKVIKNCDTLIVAGHHPHAAVLPFFNNKVEFIGFEDTCFSSSVPDTSITQLHKGLMRHLFKSYSYVCNKGVYKTFTLWEDFTRYSITKK